MNKIQFQAQLKVLFPWIGEPEFSQIEVYKTTLQTANKVQNLTRLADESTIYADYFLGSILLYNEVLPPDAHGKLLDIGTGSGIPGVLLQILYPNLQVVLLEANQKKVTFLRHLVQALHLETKIQIVQGRAEELAYQANLDRQFTWVTARALTQTQKFLELGVRFLRVGGWLLVPKAATWQEEAMMARGCLNPLHLMEKEHYETTNHGHYYHLTTYEKVAETPPEYPRPWGAILKKPLS